MPNRRTFLHGLSASALAGALPLKAATDSPRNRLCFFSKHLQGLSFDDIASVAAEVGVDGIEAPIRPKGHIEPERVPDELPKFVEALKKQGLEMTILTSGITEVSPEQHTESVLRTAAQLGIKRFRMGVTKYDLKQPIWPQLEAAKPIIKDLVALSRELGIQPLFQNHSGKDYMGAPVWDVYSLMRDYPPGELSFAFDILHATVEGGLSWPLHFQLVSDHIGAAYLKDFKWVGRKIETCPLGEGQVNPAYGKMLMESGYQGPISLHVEYLKGDAKDPAVLKSFRDAHQRDLGVVREWLAQK